MAKLNRENLERLNALYEESDAVRRRLEIFMGPAKPMEITMGGIRVRLEIGDDEIRKLIVGHLAKRENVLRTEIESMGFEITNHIPVEVATDT